MDDSSEIQFHPKYFKNSSFAENNGVCREKDQGANPEGADFEGEDLVGAGAHRQGAVGADMEGASAHQEGAVGADREGAGIHQEGAIQGASRFSHEPNLITFQSSNNKEGVKTKLIT